MYETSLLYDEKRTTEKQCERGCVSFDNCMLDLQINVRNILLPKVALLVLIKFVIKTDNLIITLQNNECTLLNSKLIIEFITNMMPFISNVSKIQLALLRS